MLNKPPELVKVENRYSACVVPASLYAVTSKLYQLAGLSSISSNDGANLLPSKLLISIHSTSCCSLYLISKPVIGQRAALNAPSLIRVELEFDEISCRFSGAIGTGRGLV